MIIFAGCGENSKTGGAPGSQSNQGLQQPGKGDCRENLEKNVDRCYKEMSRLLSNIDSNLVQDYCDCVNKEIINSYSCEQIMAMKKLTDKELLTIYKPIKEKCMQLYLKEEMDKARLKSMKDTL